jgi:hypothetical protein
MADATPTMHQRCMLAMHAVSCSSHPHCCCTMLLQLDNVLIKHVTAEGSDSWVTYAKVWCWSCGKPSRSLPCHSSTTELAVYQSDIPPGSLLVL